MGWVIFFIPSVFVGYACGLFLINIYFKEGALTTFLSSLIIALHFGGALFILYPS